MAGALGFIPASQPNVAAASVNQDLVDFGVVTLNAFGTISTATTATEYFELVEFFYACAVLDNGIPVPTGCIVEVFGYDVFGNQVGSASYAYAPTNQVLTIMNRAILPLYYIGLQNVTIAVAQGNIATATTVLYVDNVTHINCY